MEQNSYNFELTEAALHLMDAAKNVEDLQEAWLLLITARFAATNWLREAMKLTVAEEAYYNPSSDWSKEFDELCFEEMQETGLSGLSYIRAKRKALRTLGAKPRDLRLVRRLMTISNRIGNEEGGTA